MHSAMRSSRAQTSIEFLILLAFMLLIFASFFVIASDIVLQNNSRAIRQALIEVSKMAHEELLLANQVNEGYTRTFLLPKTLSDEEYTVSILDNTELVVNTSKYEYLVFLPFNVSVSGAQSGIMASGGDKKEVFILKNSSGIDVQKI